MRATMRIAIVIILAFACSAWAQQAPIYDRSYNGPVNYYGQPAYQPMYQGQAPARGGQSQQMNNGLIPKTFNGLYQAGGYLWSYMPAPLRPDQPSFVPPPESGNVTINFVPGSP